MALSIKSSGGPGWTAPIGVINKFDANQNPTMPLVGVDDQFLTATVVSTEPRDHVHVQFWVRALGTTGAPWLPSAGYVDGSLFPPDDTGVSSVTATTEFVAKQPWKPLQSDITWAAPGVNVHVCVFANAYANDGSGDGGKAGPAPQLDPWTNPHHAQANLTLVSTKTDSAMDFQMFAGNPFEEGEAMFHIDVVEVPDPPIGPAEVAQLQSVGVEFVSGRFSKRIGEELVPIRVAAEPLPELEISLGERSGRRLAPTLAAGNPEFLRLSAYVPEEPNLLRILDIQQSDADGCTVGGVRVLLLSTDDVQVADGDGYAT